MPTMDVSQNSALVGATTFQRQLMILDLDGNLHWEADDELRKASGGTIQIWALRESEGYFIRFVLPTWTLMIDSIVYEPELYQDINLKGRHVELKFQDYTLCFTDACFAKVLDT
jgi:hypothetical protein